MAIKGLSLNEEETYITRDDPGIVMREGVVDVEASLRAGATGFIITNIPSGIMSRIADMNQILEQNFGSTTQRLISQIAQKNREAFKYGVKQFINFSDNDDRIIECQREQTFEAGRMVMVVKEETLDRIPTSVLSEVGNQVIRRNSMTEQTAKNFEALLSQLGASGTSVAENATAPTKSEEGMTKTGLDQTTTENPNTSEANTGSTQ